LISIDDDLPSTRRVPPLLGLPADPAPEAPLRCFSVEISYVEPGYAASVHAEPKTYSSRFSVQAVSAEGAVADARARFHEIWRASGVGWERRITGVRVVPSEG
jgi:hypothetical protein